mmetsp:Transcript_14487/g.21948  ORF Transcript_14487/g.21948 Transcript_14487/m.21948 type:complete len:169 (+) Transcript_14487:59-565(+)
MDLNSDDEQKESNPLPMHMVGHSRKKKGWGGQEMEMDHRLRQIRSSKEESSSSATITAVDLSQFRNEEVGKGYQHRGVVRQKMGSGAGQAMKIVDMTKKDDDNDGDRQKSSTSTKHKKEKSAKKQKRKRDKKEAKETKEEKSSKYLRCEAVRIFRKEIEKIVLEAATV